MQQVEGGANPEPAAATDTSLPRHLASASVCAITWKVAAVRVNRVSTPPVPTGTGLGPGWVLNEPLPPPYLARSHF